MGKYSSVKDFILMYKITFLFNLFFCGIQLSKYSLFDIVLVSIDIFNEEGNKSPFAEFYCCHYSLKHKKQQPFLPYFAKHSKGAKKAYLFDTFDLTLQLKCQDVHQNDTYVNNYVQNIFYKNHLINNFLCRYYQATL